MRMQILSIGLLLAGTVTQAKAADVLPEGAKPLTTTEIEDLYSGNTYNWEKGRIFFSPDKTAIAYYDKQYAEEFADGTWSAIGNELCTFTKWTSKQGSTNEFLCRKLYKVGSEIIVQETKKSEGSLSTYPLLTSLISKGDKTHDRYIQLKKLISD